MTREWYASRGWPLVPIWWTQDGRCACGQPPGDCKPGKHPIGHLVPNGVKNASTDPATIRAWWRREPRANLAVRTGPESNLLVLDVDDAEGERSLLALERRYGALPELYPHQWTGGGRGGWQAFFAYPEGRKVANSVGRLGPKLDTRGVNGYAVFPPSVTIERYRWSTDREPWTLPPAPAPAWLVDLLDPLPAPEPERRAFDAYQPSCGDRYGWRALESELALLAMAGQGRRNDQLNRSAHALFRLVRDGRLYRDDVDFALTEAARFVGLSDREIRATIISAARARGLTP
jgi:Bifunctional DNA primase/polymerase, N-terminal